MKLVYPTIINSNEKSFKAITYFGPCSSKLAKIIIDKNSDLNIAFTTCNKLGKHIRNNKDKTNKGDKSGIYKLKCGSCNKFYIGQTGRTFNTRINEHKQSFLKNKSDSTYSNHLLLENHTFNEDFEVLHVNNKCKKLSFLECLEINKYKDTGLLLNDQTEINNTPLLNLKLRIPRNDNFMSCWFGKYFIFFSL